MSPALLQVLSAALYSHHIHDDTGQPDYDAAGPFYAQSVRKKYVFPVKQACLAFVLLAIGIVMTVVGVTQGSLGQSCQSRVHAFVCIVNRGRLAPDRSPCSHTTEYLSF